MHRACSRVLFPCAPTHLPRRAWCVYPHVCVSLCWACLVDGGHSCAHVCVCLCECVLACLAHVCIPVCTCLHVRVPVCIPVCVYSVAPSSCFCSPQLSPRQEKGRTQLDSSPSTHFGTPSHLRCPPQPSGSSPCLPYPCPEPGFGDPTQATQSQPSPLTSLPPGPLTPSSLGPLTPPHPALLGGLLCPAVKQGGETPSTVKWGEPPPTEMGGAPPTVKWGRPSTVKWRGAPSHCETGGGPSTVKWGGAPPQPGLALRPSEPRAVAEQIPAPREPRGWGPAGRPGRRGAQQRLFKCSIGEGLKFTQGHRGCDNYNHRF